MTTTAAPVEPAREVIAELPPWLAALAYTDDAQPPCSMRVTLPVPPIANLEQLAYQREQYDAQAMVAGMLVGHRAPAPPTLQATFVMDEQQVRAFHGALGKLLEACERRRGIVDATEVKPAPKPRGRVIDVDGD